MQIKIVVDSCCEIPSKWKDFIERAPLTIDLDNKSYKDDDNLDMNSYLSHMKHMKSFKTSCPSTEEYLNLYKGDEDVIVITLSEKLSGSYQSAQIAKDMYFQKNDTNKTIHIVNSKSASAGQTSILAKLIELCEKNINIDKLIKEIEDFRDNHNVMFMLQSLTNLAKGGRVSSIIAKATNVLGIRCIMVGDPEGKIELKQKIIGEKRCLMEIARSVGEISSNLTDLAERTLCISHCQGMDKVDSFLENLKQFIDIRKFKNILINHTSALSSLYADFGGIIIGF